MTFQTSYHGVRKWLTNSPTTNWTFISSGLDAASSTRISLCHSGFGGRPVFSSVRGIVTFNDCKSYCLDSSTLTFSHIHPVLQSFLIKGGKYMETQGNSWNSGKFGQFAEFFMSNTCSNEVPKLPKPRIPKRRQLTTQRDKGSLNSSTQAKPSQLEQPRLGATVQPYPVIT